MGAAFGPPPRDACTVPCDGVVFLHGFGTVDRESDGVAQISAHSLCVVRRTGDRRYFQCHLAFPAERGELVAFLGDRVVDRAELLALEAEFLGLADHAVAAGLELWPYAEPVFCHPAGYQRRLAGFGTPARIAPMTRSRPPSAIILRRWAVRR